MSHHFKLHFLGVTLVVGILFLLNIALGSVRIPLADVVSALLEGSTGDSSWHYIIWESRLPQAIVALLGGATLATSGLLLQTAFRNPLAGPDVFGVSSGAGLAVALVMLWMGGNLSMGDYSIGGFLAVMVSAFLGAMAVMGIITFLATIVRNQVMLLVVGIMIGYLASSAISLLSFLATAEGVKSYMVWGMGSFGNTSMNELPWFAVIATISLVCSILLVKPLNAFLLGENYARNLGFNVRRIQVLLMLVTGLQTAVVTAFCGPIAFVGLATPHISRLLMSTDNQRLLLPMTMLLGSVIALFCNLLCVLPSDGSVIPLNAVTPLLGAPVIIYVLVKKRQ